MIKRFIGIDPGKSGAVAILEMKDELFSRVITFDTPVLKGDKGAKSSYDPAGMARIISSGTSKIDTDESHVVIESVHSMPGQGVSSSFDFGKGLGIWIGILAALQTPYTLVSPQRWKKAMLADVKQEKSASRGRAAQLFPSAAELFARVKDDGRAEALLMAEYGRRTQTFANKQALAEAA
jgi:crossover junction endodeoxyribonuclease RuvC